MVAFFGVGLIACFRVGLPVFGEGLPVIVGLPVIRLLGPVITGRAIAVHLLYLYDVDIRRGTPVIIRCNLTLDGVPLLLADPCLLVDEADVPNNTHSQP